MTTDRGPTVTPPSTTTAQTWPETCAEAHGVVFHLRRRGLPLLPGVSTDDWASSILRWSTGRAIRCIGLDEAA